MHTLIPIANDISDALRRRGETVAVVESSAGGLLSASLLSVAGASAYYIGGAVAYTAAARQSLLAIGDDEMRGLRSSSEPYAQLLARTVRERHRATWGLAETGAAGPTGNRYGDAAGHSCIAVDGPRVSVHTIETRSAERHDNMRAFARDALTTLREALRIASEGAGTQG